MSGSCGQLGLSGSRATIEARTPAREGLRSAGTAALKLATRLAKAAESRSLRLGPCSAVFAGSGYFFSSISVSFDSSSVSSSFLPADLS